MMWKRALRGGNFFSRKTVNWDSLNLHFTKNNGSEKNLLLKDEARMKTALHLCNMNEVESLDYRSADDTPKRMFYRHSNHSLKDGFRLVSKWFIYLMIGVSIGVIAWIIKTSIDYLQSLKIDLVEKCIQISLLFQTMPFIYLHLDFVM